MREIMRRFHITIGQSFVMMILFLGVPTIANAQQTGSCTVTTTPIVFGTYNPLLRKNLTSVGMLHYRCFGNHGRLTISLTEGASGSFNARVMRRAEKTLIYNLYLDAAGTQVWGDGTRGSQMYIVNSPPGEGDDSIPIYGRVFGTRNASAGDYRDIVSVILRY